MFCMAIFETDEKRKSTLHDYLTQYIFEKDMDLDIFWFTDQHAVQKLEKYSDDLCLALVSLEEIDGRRFGQQLYSLNPTCRICYYKTVSCDLESLLTSRPIRFYLWDLGQKEFSDMMNSLISEIEAAMDFFCFSTRREIYYLPTSSILYCESDLKHVLIYCKNNKKIRIFAKLSEVEDKLGTSFIRIHKSYIVNRLFVKKIDKQTHTCRIADDMSLPISDAQYGKVVKIFI